MFHVKHVVRVFHVKHPPRRVSPLRVLSRRNKR
nr:MAG TPA: hypothetical protein [Caudoviricetes sp.]